MPSLISGLPILKTALFSMKFEFVAGFLSHLNLSPTFILFLMIVIGWFLCSTSFMTFFLIEITIISTVIWRLEKKIRVFSLIIKFIFSRIVIWWLFYTIYSQWYTENITLLTCLSFITFPLLFSWYIFDPFLLPHRRYSLSDRFDYFLSRFIFFTGFGLIPFVILFLCLFLDYPNYLIFITICIICHHHSREPHPYYARYIPYTKNQHIVDPLDHIESLIDSYF